MNCNEARHQWHVYHDSEGDAALHGAINEHLEMCPGCAEWFHQQNRLEEVMAARLGPRPRTPELWDEVLRSCNLRRPAPARRRLLFTAIAACAATLILAVLLGWDRWRSSPTADLARLSAAWHQRLAEGKEAVPFRSQSDLEVEGYLRRQVSFPVRCPPRKDAGFTVQGAGVCQLAGQPAAYLLGQVEATPVSIFILPHDSLTAFPRQRDALRHGHQHRCQEGGYEMVMGAIDRNAVLVIGQAKPQHLEKVLNAYGTYPQHH